MTMKIVRFQGDDIKMGVIAHVFPFPEVCDACIVVRTGGCVDLDGSLWLSPNLARQFAKSLCVAARIAEGPVTDEELCVSNCSCASSG